MLRCKVSSLILQHTVLSRAHLTPELALRLITPECPLWTARAEELPFPDPFWGFYWPGGQATARYILDNPKIVENKTVLDLGCGCGAGAIAAAKMKAKNVVANDIDVYALEATCINAALNGISLTTSASNLIGEKPLKPHCDTVLVGDMFYDSEFAETLFKWLMTLKGTTVLIGDPGRHGLTQRTGLKRLATYQLPPNSCLENRGFAETTLWQLDIK
ncbi:electron transfer flavoprotein beta subunit lysine methyltransferase-like isoform X2 [Leguminivora glycinivorella]|nr:electron transfer flavoprotein beta subunit lysine methyltransferase-like isoform X2 [Leguminivora glycinivorella]XP_047996654.1 electron transfer flavoprotein beta subunit lysine methyltransferase-like isoform X2 [Leguminivora glycinivorella]XP_047996661.1 electron transfer flavoprotein beta subunit lysine methyltransferase-like isoform X2 [Leguminivora glycinivorella]XP_047996671.1 electron transfer flavoprotein beta subunit lysine methyltransferase-like isoform X2 [Leguminivora glycinivore